MIVLKGVSLRRGAKVLLDAASAVINPGEKVGLVGRNGAGKSTVLFGLNVFFRDVDAQGVPITNLAEEDFHNRNTAEPRAILQTFRDLRFMDETLYLRSGTLNIFNGIVGLTFSCDGSHYMPWTEFLDKRVDFWLGTPTRA